MPRESPAQQSLLASSTERLECSRSIKRLSKPAFLANWTTCGFVTSLTPKACKLSANWTVNVVAADRDRGDRLFVISLVASIGNWRRHPYLAKLPCSKPCPEGVLTGKHTCFFSDYLFYKNILFFTIPLANSTQLFMFSKDTQPRRGSPN